MRPSLLPAVLLSAALALPLAAAGPALAQSAPPSPTAAATPTATTSPTPPAPGPSGTQSPRPILSVSPARLVAGNAASVRVQGRTGETVVLLAYTRPSTTLVEVRRTVIDDSGFVVWSIRPTAGTRLVAESRNQRSDEVVLPVAPAVSLSANRTGPCPVFRGRVFPAAAGRTVDIVRELDGRDVVLSRTSVGSDGVYNVLRCFQGPTQQLTIVARTPSTLAHLPARSAPVCQPVACRPEVVVEEADDGRTVQLAVGQKLLVRLVQNTSTGYRLEPRAVDASVLSGPRRTDVDPPAGSMPGAAGSLELRYTAVGAGTTVVRVDSTPPGASSPESTYTLTVRVS
ncbi:MAG: hypothetical protein JWO60_1607 [Frankiales bacterium]|nr:hypothetical protein [Frankiales bacterium]